MKVVLVVTELDLRAGARVLRGLLNHDHPMVQRAIRDSLADSGRWHVLGCLARMEAALLAPTEAHGSRWARLRARWRRWVERNWATEYPGSGAL
jgi:hypothetical protein